MIKRIENLKMYVLVSISMSDLPSGGGVVIYVYSLSQKSLKI